MIYFIKIQWLNPDTFNLLIPYSLLMILLFFVFMKTFNWKLLYISKWFSETRPKGAITLQLLCNEANIRCGACFFVTSSQFSLTVCTLQYSSSCMRTDPEWSPTHRADPSTIFLSPLSNKRSPAHTEYQTENRIKNHISYSWEREGSVRDSVLNKCRENTKDEASRSIQPLKIQHRQRSGPIAVSSLTRCCSQLSAFTADEWRLENTFTSERVTGWWCRPSFVECVLNVCFVCVSI